MVLVIRYQYIIQNIKINKILNEILLLHLKKHFSDIKISLFKWPPCHRQDSCKTFQQSGRRCRRRSVGECLQGMFHSVDLCHSLRGLRRATEEQKSSKKASAKTHREQFIDFPIYFQTRIKFHFNTRGSARLRKVPLKFEGSITSSTTLQSE